MVTYNKSLMAFMNAKWPELMIKQLSHMRAKLISHLRGVTLRDEIQIGDGHRSLERQVLAHG